MEPDMKLIKQQDQHSHNPRNKDKLRLPSIKSNQGKQMTEFHAVSDYNTLGQEIRESTAVHIFKRKISKF